MRKICPLCGKEFICKGNVYSICEDPSLECICLDCRIGLYLPYPIRECMAQVEEGIRKCFGFQKSEISERIKLLKVVNGFYVSVVELNHGW